MNQVQDRKALVDFLEDALSQAVVAQTPKCIQQELDQELKQALLEYEKALILEQPGTVASQPIAAPESAGAADAKLRLLTHREPWYRALVDNARAVLGMTTPDYSKISAHVVETDLLIEQTPWYRDIFSQAKDLWNSRRISLPTVTARPVEIQELYY